MVLTILLTVIYAVILIFGGILDGQRDWAKSSNDRFVPAEFKRYSVYFQSGNGQDGWRAKWKNGNPQEGEAFWGANGFFIFLTDWFHFAKQIYNIFLMSAMSLLTYIAISILYFDGRIWVAVLYSTICILLYQFFNAWGFVAMEKQNKIAVRFSYFWQRIGLKLFLWAMYRWNKGFAERYIN